MIFVFLSAPAFLLLPPVALAGALSPANYCHFLPELEQAVAYCYQNEFFDQASELCLQKFKKQVVATQARLAGSFQNNQEGSVAAQNSKLTNQEKNLSQTDHGLKQLLETARKARSELVAYQRAMIFPGSPSIGFVQRFQLESHLATFSCFREPWESVGLRITELDQKIMELERADGKALALHKNTSGDNRNLQQLQPGSRAARSVAAAGSGAKKNGDAPQKQSTITGEIKKPGASTQR